jgi:cobalt-zinc-cadmium efflux system outer membrane protein
MGYPPRAVALLLAVVGSVSSHAQMLSEMQFVEDALANHPGIAIAEADVAAVSGGRRQAGIFGNPDLSWEREEADVALRQDTWRLSWRLPFDGRKHRVAAADAAVAASTAIFDATRFDIRGEMRTLFAAWFIAIEREAVLQSHLDHTRRLAEWVRARAEQGEAAGVEARRLELEVEVLSRQLAEVRADARAQQAAAATWSDLVSDETRPRRPLLPPPPDTVDVAGSPDIVALTQRVAEAEARHELQKRVLEPPEISLGWQDIRGAEQSVDGPVFAVAWPVPLFDRNQGNRETAAARTDRARSELELKTRRAVQDASVALAWYSSLYSTAASHGSDASDSDVVVSVLAAFEAGEASLTDVLDSLRTTVDVRIARIETLAGALAAERKLEAAIGRPILPGGSS